MEVRPQSPTDFQSFRWIDIRITRRHEPGKPDDLFAIAQLRRPRANNPMAESRISPAFDGAIDVKTGILDQVFRNPRNTLEIPHRLPVGKDLGERLYVFQLEAPQGQTIGGESG